MKDSRFLGRSGEDKAAEYLVRKGYSIIDRNYKSRFGEIDIIAANKQYIVFVEVKARKNSDNGEAREFVNYSKQNRIRNTALMWLASNDTALQPRFDVIELYTSASFLQKKLNHIENAFE